MQISTFRPVMIGWEVICVDIRESIIRAVMMALQGRIPDNAIDTVQDVLVIQLNGYEIQERCTAVAIKDNSAEGMLNRFIATKTVEGLSEKTLKRYREQNQQLIWFLQKPLYEVTTYDLRFFLSWRRENGYRGRKIKNRTLDGMRRCFSSFFSWLSAEGLIGRNPCAALAQIKYRKTIRKPFSAAELDRLRMACKTKRDLALVDFLYATGCRVSEVVNLDISDVDFEKGECIVLGKGNKERVVYLSEVASRTLQEYLDSRKDFADALFIGRGQRRISKEGIEAAVKRIGWLAGVEDVYPHRFRHTLATHLVERGMDILKVAAVLGHADISTTQIYCYNNRTATKADYLKYAA